MYPRNRTLRALCLTHVDLHRIRSALAALTDGGTGMGIGWSVGGSGGDVACSGQRAGAAGVGAWGWSDECRQAFEDAARIFAHVDAGLVEFVVSKIVVQAQFFFDMMR